MRRISTVGTALALLALGLGAARCRCEEQRSDGPPDGGGRAEDDAATTPDDGASPRAPDAAGADAGPATTGDAGPMGDADRRADGDSHGDGSISDGAAAPEPDAQDGGTAEDGGAERPTDDLSDASPPSGPEGDGAATDGGHQAAEATTDASAEESDPEARRFAGLVQRHYREARGFEADFAQTYRNRLMGRNQKSSGHVWLRPPDRMRWEYAPPSKNLIVADGRHLFVFEPEPNQVIRMPVSGSELPSVMAFLTGGRNLEEDYRVRTVHRDELEPRGQAGLELRPRRPSSVVARVVLVVSRAAGEVLRTVLVDPEGNTNTFVWAEVRTDRDLPDSRFTFSPPAGARVVER